MELVAHLRLSKQALIGIAFCTGRAKRPPIKRRPARKSGLFRFANQCGTGWALLGCLSGQGVYEAPRRGHVAEWLRNGLQNRVHQFNSGRGLHL